MSAAYTRINLDALVQHAIDNILADKLKVDPLKLATYFWPIMANYDMRDVPADQRVSEAIGLVRKAMDLYTEAFKWFTRITEVPTADQAAHWNEYNQVLKEAYAKANHLSCCPQGVVAALKSMVQNFNDMYTSLDGLNKLAEAQKAGKHINWDIYGPEGNAMFGPMQIGWDWEKLLEAKSRMKVYAYN
jgi:hypothetical protein